MAAAAMGHHSMHPGLALVAANQRIVSVFIQRRAVRRRLQCTCSPAAEGNAGQACNELHHLAQSALCPAHALCPAGTNDNHRLLPLQVRQQLQVEPVLHATNGRMLAILLDNPQYDTLAVPEVRIT